MNKLMKLGHLEKVQNIEDFRVSGSYNREEDKSVKIHRIQET